MLVKQWMTKTVIPVDKNDSMLHAITLLKEHNIHRLPVMENGQLVGIVSDKDLIRPSIGGVPGPESIDMLYRITKVKVEDVMTKNPIIIPADYTMDEAADILLKNKISGAPVINDESDVVGIITRTDILRAQKILTGLDNRGISFAFQLNDQPGSIKAVSDIIRDYGGRIASVHTSYEEVPKGFQEVYLRIYGIDRKRSEELKQELGQKAKVIYMVDHAEKKRIYY